MKLNLKGWTLMKAAGHTIEFEKWMAANVDREWKPMKIFAITFKSEEGKMILHKLVVRNGKPVVSGNDILREQKEVPLTVPVPDFIKEFCRG